MFERQEVLLYYLTLYNEVYPMPSIPEGAEDGILKGMYRLPPRDGPRGRAPSGWRTRCTSCWRAEASAVR